MARQDSAFYTNTAGMEIVWDGDENGRFYVVRNGEMRIHYTHEDGHEDVIRYTDQLERLGVLTDEDLQRFSDLGEERFTWVSNSWFELVDNDDPDDGVVYHELDEAVERAIHLAQRQADGE